MAVAPKPKPPATLTPKQERFVAEYLIDLNAGAAAIRSGFTGRHPRKAGYQMLKMPAVAAAVEAGKVTRAGRTKVDQDYVVTAAQEVVERCLQRQGARDGFNATGAVSALTLLAKHTGGFSDRMKIAIDDPEALAKQLRDLPKPERKSFILKMLTGQL